MTKTMNTSNLLFPCHDRKRAIQQNLLSLTDTHTDTLTLENSVVVVLLLLLVLVVPTS